MGKGGTLWLHRSYNNVEKDPEIDKFRTIYQKEHIKENDLAILSGLASTTVTNLFGGQTRQPRHSTFAKIAGAMGYEYGLRRETKPDYESELPVAREQYKAHKEALAKKRDRRPAKKKKR